MGTIRKTKQEKKIAARKTYAALCGVGFCWAYFLGGVLAYRLLVFLLCWPLLSLGYLLLARKHLRVSQRVEPDTPNKDSSCVYSVEFQNNSKLFFLPHVYVRIREFDGYQDTPAEGVTGLSPRAHTTLRLRMRFLYRGAYHVGVETVRLTDPLGLFTCRPSPPERLTVTVYPRLLPLKACCLPHSSLSERNRRNRGLWEDRSEIRDLRGYQHGDALGRIHWKLSARKNQLITKLYEHEEGAEHLFVLDTVAPCEDKRAALETSDRMVESVLALMLHTLEDNVPVRLIHNTSGELRQMNFRTARALTSCLDCFSSLSFDATEPVETLLHAQGVCAGFSALTLITARRSDTPLGALSELHSAQAPVSMIVIEPRGTEEIPARAAPWQGHVFTAVIHPDDDLIGALSADMSGEKEVRSS